MQAYRYIWNFVKHSSGHFVGRVVEIVLALMVVGTLFIMNVPGTQARTQVATGKAAPNVASIEGTINQVFGANGPAAIRVAQCESSLNPNATNTTPVGGSHAEGLFQILYPSTWQSTSQAANSPYDAWANTVAAHEIFVRDGYSWREWVCQP